MMESEPSERLAIGIAERDGDEADVQLLCDFPRILKINIWDVYKILRLSSVILFESVAVFTRNSDDISDVLLIFAGQILNHTKFYALRGVKVEQGVNVIRV